MYLKFTAKAKWEQNFDITWLRNYSFFDRDPTKNGRDMTYSFDTNPYIHLRWLFNFDLYNIKILLRS